MALLSCPECQTENSSTAVSCTNCGYAFQVERRGIVGKLMKYIFIWFHWGLLLAMLTPFFIASFAPEVSPEHALAAGFGFLFGVLIWFGGALFWGILVYITKGKLRPTLTKSESKRDKAIFWSGMSVIALVFLLPVMVASQEQSDDDINLLLEESTIIEDLISESETVTSAFEDSYDDANENYFDTEYNDSAESENFNTDSYYEHKIDSLQDVIQYLNEIRESERPQALLVSEPTNTSPITDTNKDLSLIHISEPTRPY